MKNKIVYSTNPDFKQQPEKADEKSVPAAGQTLYISLERHKGGKIATIVENFTGTTDALEQLGKTLKSKCGTGGTVKDGIILIQGEKREQVITLLEGMGYKTKRKGG